MLRYQWRGGARSDGEGVSDVGQGGCGAADGWMAGAPRRRNGGVTPQAEIQQVNNEESHPATHPPIRSLRPRNHNEYSADSTPKHKHKF
jgi:hypothetical protein